MYAGSGNYARVFAGSVHLEEEGEARPCAIKRLSVDKGLRAERLLQEALTMIKCQDPSRPLLRAVALGDDQYCLVSEAAGAADGGSGQSGPQCTGSADRLRRQSAASASHCLPFLVAWEIWLSLGAGAHGPGKRSLR